MKFLLITGAYRSGTSYLHKVFECNPKCQVLFQPAIKYFKLIDLSIRKKLKKKGFNNFPLGVMKINKKISLEKILLTKNEILNLTSKLIRSEKKNLYFYKKIYTKVKLEKNFVNSEKLLNIIFDSVEKPGQKKIIVGIKEPYLGNLLIPMSNLKNIYIINIIRDPREIIYSRNYAEIKNHSDFRSKKHPVILSSLLCLRNMESDIMLKNNKNYYSMKFKDLVYKRNKIERDLKKFLKIKVSLDLKKNLKKKWKINSSGLKGNHGSKWKDKMLKSNIAIIEKICGNKFRNYGFGTNIKNKNTLNTLVKRFKEDRNKILKWTNKPLFIKYNSKKLNNI